MPRLVACPNCQSHVIAPQARCPHCDGPLRRAGGHLALTAAAALLGLSPLACEKDGPQPAPPSDSGGVAEPEYGAPATNDPADSYDPADPADPADPDAPADPHDAPHDAPHDDPHDDPDNGVPVTDDDGPTMQPMYGVPDSEVPSAPPDVHMEPEYGVPE